MCWRLEARINGLKDAVRGQGTQGGLNILRAQSLKPGCELGLKPRRVEQIASGTVWGG